MKTKILCAAVGLLTIVALKNLFDVAGTQGDPYQIAIQVERFAPVAAIVPAVLAIGYVSDLDPASSRGIAAFSSATYAIAPRLLVRLQDAAVGGWVIGNFTAPQDFAAFGDARGLTFQQDLGNGVVLFKRASK